MNGAMNGGAKPRIWVIGASGYVGARLLAAAAAHGQAFGTSSRGGNGLHALDLQAVDDFDFGAIAAGDVVIVTAAVSSPDVCANDHAYAHAVNVTGCGEVIARSVSRGARVIFLSSDVVYGPAETPVTEEAPCHPLGVYAAMKRAVEERFWGEAQVRIARLSYVFSADDKFSRYIAGCASRGAAAEVFHPFYRNAIYREDVIAGLLAMAHRWDSCPDGAVNFGGPVAVSRRDIAQSFQRLVFPQLKIDVVEPEPAFFNERPRHIHLDTHRLTTILGRAPLNIDQAIAADFVNGDH